MEECLDEFAIESLLKTQAALDASSEHWEHYLWTLDKSLIPNTIAWMKKLNITVREIKELKGYNETVE
jgi:hypothetical protein